MTSRPPQTRTFWPGFSIFRCCLNWRRGRQNCPPKATTLLAVDSFQDEHCGVARAGGNFEGLGLAVFPEIRPARPEFPPATHYQIKNRLFAWLDRHLHFVDTFVNAELRSIRAHFEGIATSYVERMPIVPLFETAAAA